MIFTRIIGVLLVLLGIFGIVCGFLAFGDIGIAVYILAVSRDIQSHFVAVCFNTEFKVFLNFLYCFFGDFYAE